MGICKIWNKGELTIETLVADALRKKDILEIGAIACFFGIVRSRNYKGEEVRELELESYKEVAETSFQNISDDIEKKFDIKVSIHHVIGKLKVGDLIMAVTVAGFSRKKVFLALNETVERVKSESALWKKELLKDGRSFWIEYKGSIN